ncbi:MAG: aminotransferase class V-fold PLP-dependent enzyme [Candidatus Thorarchaeota archaeon]|nr:aminotransferase class V-fold PLP-dependent enzyme [Candidatus Thorarchaeota archaeon]
MNLKSDFGVYDSIPNLAYFDSISTTLVPRISAEGTKKFLETIAVSSRRGAHNLAVQGGSKTEDVRRNLAKHLATNQYQLSFQKSIPTAVASFAYGVYGQNKERSKIIISQNEENSVLVSLLRIAEVLKLEIEVIPIDVEGTLDMAFLERKIDEKTGIVAVGHVTVGTGTTNPINQISKITNEKQALLLTDATRSIGFLDFKPQNLGADVVLFSGNIGLMGPPGLAIQWIKSEIGESHIPGILGGSAVANVEPKSYELSLQPDKFEAGTLNIPAIVGLGESLAYTRNLGIRNIINHLRSLWSHLEKRFSELKEVQLYGSGRKYGTILGFNIGHDTGINCHEVAMFLDDSNIAVRSGLLCAHPLIKPMASEGLVQISIHAYNTKSDIDRMIEALHIIIRELL